jgi:hypothetical protein
MTLTNGECSTTVVRGPCSHIYVGGNSLSISDMLDSELAELSDESLDSLLILDSELIDDELLYDDSEL